MCDLDQAAEFRRASCDRRHGELGDVAQPARSFIAISVTRALAFFYVAKLQTGCCS